MKYLVPSFLSVYIYIYKDVFAETNPPKPSFLNTMTVAVMPPRDRNTSSESSHRRTFSFVFLFRYCVCPMLLQPC